MKEKRSDSTRRRRNLTVNIFLALVSTMVVLVTAELALRLIQGPADPPPPRYLEHDELLGWHKRPGAVAVHQTSEYNVTERINSRGLRGSEYPYEKESDEFRVLVLGDSFAEGAGVRFDVLFSSVMQEQLNRVLAPARHCVVINAGTSGYSTDQELLFFEHEGRKYQPNVTVLLFCYNDVWYNAQPRNYFSNAAKPLFVWEQGRLCLTNVPVPRRDALFFDHCGKTTTDRPTLKQWLAEKSRIYALVREAVKKNFRLHNWALRAGLAHVVPEEMMQQDGKPIARCRTLGCWQQEYSPEIQYCWNLTEALLVRLRDAVAAAGSTLLVVNVPSRACIYPPVLEATRRQYGLDETWRPEQIGIELRRRCARHEIDYLDPTAALRAAEQRLRKEKQSVYYPRDGHWTAAGHKVIGLMLAGHITGHYGLE